MNNKEFFQFNINDYVYVKLNPESRKYLIDRWNLTYDGAQYSIPVEYHRTEADIDKITDSDGYTKFQMHNFMHYLGEDTYVGGKPLFDTNIRFEKANFKEIE